RSCDAGGCPVAGGCPSGGVVVGAGEPVCPAAMPGTRSSTTASQTATMVCATLASPRRRQRAMRCQTQVRAPLCRAASNLPAPALARPEIYVALIDEKRYRIDFGRDAGVVAIGCWNVQYRRARELATECRRRGKLVVVGGPYASLCRERFEDGAFDVVFNGEVEITWPQFCQDLLAGRQQTLYRQEGNVDIRLSPVPRFDLIQPNDYIYYFAQTTRGCPFQCEFC